MLSRTDTPRVTRRSLLALMALGACSPGASMDEPSFQATEAWVRSYYENFQAPAFDLERHMAYYAPDVHFVDPTFDIDVSGSDEVRALYASIGTAESSYSDIRWNLDRVLISGTNDVTIHGSWSGVFQGSSFDIQFVTLWRLRDDEIIEQKDFFDAPTFDEQVGWTGGA